MRGGPSGRPGQIWLLVFTGCLWLLSGHDGGRENSWVLAVNLGKEDSDSHLLVAVRLGEAARCIMKAGPTGCMCTMRGRSQG